MTGDHFNEKAYCFYDANCTDITNNGVNGKISADNSTSETLSASGTYAGTWEDISQFASISVIGTSDENATLYFDFSIDGSTIVRTVQLSSGTDSSLGIHSLIPVAQYGRVRIVDGGSGAAIVIQTLYHKSARIAQPTSRLTQTISDYLDVLNTRSILTGKTQGGFYDNVGINTEGKLKVDVPISAFGELEAVNPTPVVQADFIYNINADLVSSSTTGSGTVTQSNAMAVLQTGAATSSTAELITNRFVKYRPGQGVHIRGTALFTTGVAGSTQLFGAGDDDNGVFFGYNGTSFGVLRRSGGTDNWTAQTAWNGDRFDGSGGLTNPTGDTIDPTKGNVFEIQFQWLGFGEIVFAIEDEQTGRFVPVHTIPYANNNTEPSMLNPSFPLGWFVENTTNNTNITVKGASCCAEIEGEIRLLGPRNSIDNSKTGVGTTLTNILTIRNKSTFVSQTNKTPVIVSKYSAAVDGTKPATFELILNATLGGTPSYTDISTNTSVIDYDTAGTTVTGGKLLDGAALGKTGSVDITPFLEDVQLNPGDTLTLAVKASSGTTDVSCFVKWIEDF